MKKAWIVARHEFVTTVKRWGFLIVTFGLPLFSGGIMGLSVFLQSDIIEREQVQRRSARLGFVDEAGLITLPPPEGADWKRYASKAEAAAKTAADNIQIVVVIPANYRERAEVGVLVTLRPSIFSLEGRFVQRDFYSWLAQNVLKDVDAKRVELARTTPAENIEFLRPGGAVSDTERPEDYLKRAAAGAGFVLILFISLSVASGYLIQGMADEKENRVLEMVISSMSPVSLMAGKLIGLGSVGLLQVFLWTLTGVGLAVYFGALFIINPGLWIVCGIYYILGYALFGSLLLGIGSLGTNLREAQQYTAGITLLSIAPVMILPAIVGEPQGVLARVLSYVPFTAPVTMMMRFGVDAAHTAAWEVALSIVVLVASTILAVRISAKLYRVGLLMYGKRPTLKELWRWTWA